MQVTLEAHTQIIHIYRHWTQWRNHETHFLYPKSSIFPVKGAENDEHAGQGQILIPQQIHFMAVRNSEFPVYCCLHKFPGAKACFSATHIFWWYGFVAAAAESWNWTELSLCLNCLAEPLILLIVHLGSAKPWCRPILVVPNNQGYQRRMFNSSTFSFLLALMVSQPNIRRWSWHLWQRLWIFPHQLSYGHKSARHLHLLSPFCKMWKFANFRKLFKKVCKDSSYLHMPSRQCLVKMATRSGCRSHRWVFILQLI